ncbi:MAG TPA: EAL domain-containing protein [Sulfuricurvum sp.]|nr:EAL domain-containing protein [Sulfuricurvum sp.]
MKKKILIVEDEGIVALDLQDRLEFLGYQVIGIADTAKSALKMVAKKSPDLVLMDIVIKGETDGIDTARQIHDLFSIPVVFLTAYADDKTLARAKLSNPHGYIVKPFNAQMLHSNIEMALHRHEVDRALETCYSTTLSSIGDAVISFDHEGKIRYLNPMAEALTGWKAKEAIKNDLHDVFILINTQISEEEPINPLTLMDKQIFSSLPSGFELKSKFGTLIPIALNIIPMHNHDKDSENEAGIIIFSDKREHIVSERQIKMAEKIFDHSIEGIILTDNEMRIQQVNKTFTEVTGYEFSEIIGKTPAILKSGHHDKDFYNTMWAMIKRTGMWQGQIYNRRKNGDVYPEWLSIYSIKNTKGVVINYIGLFSDLTEKRITQDQIHYLAHHDALTGLPNRLLFMDRLKQSITVARRKEVQLALFFIDLDGFKKINDTLGHDAGDILLQEVSLRLKKFMRESDTVCRLGGDEFTVIIEGYNQIGDIIAIVNKILKELSIPVEIGERIVYITASIGISIYPDDGNDIQNLVKNADTAMYSAKEKGKNRYEFYDQEMNRKNLERLTLESCIHRAYDDKEFMVYYQPKIDLLNNRLFGIEALIRWNHPTLGFVPPMQFIPLAEETGMIIPIGEWIIRKVCQDIQNWAEQGLEYLKVSINLSAIQFRDPNLIKIIDTIIEQSGIDAQYIEMEITESMLMYDVKRSIDMMKQLKSIGVSISIDDFGTGYSSLKYLKHFPIDILKIDKSFIDEIPFNNDDCAITKAIIDLAHNLGIEVIAEGIEKAEQIDFLIKNGCTKGQGFYFSKAVDSQKFYEYAIEQKSLHEEKKQ